MSNIFISCLLFSILISLHGKAQDMNPEKLQDIISQVSDTLVANGNSYRFIYNDRPQIMHL